MTHRIPTVPIDSGAFSVAASNVETDRGVFTVRGNFYIYATGTAGGATCCQLAFTRTDAPGSANRWQIPVNVQCGPFSMSTIGGNGTHIWTKTDAGTATVYVIGATKGG
jgi:hypothetical protein